MLLNLSLPGSSTPRPTCWDSRSKWSSVTSRFLSFLSFPLLLTSFPSFFTSQRQILKSGQLITGLTLLSSLTGCSDPVSFVKIPLLGYLAEVLSTLTSLRTRRKVETPLWTWKLAFLSDLHLTVLSGRQVCVCAPSLLLDHLLFFQMVFSHCLFNLLRQQESRMLGH